MTGVDTKQVSDGDKGQTALDQLSHGGAVTMTGVSKSQGWYDSQSGDFINSDDAQHKPSKPNAVYIYDDHYYAAVGTDKDKLGNITNVKVENPWNQADGPSGNFSLSADAFKKIFWGYGIT